MITFIKMLQGSEKDMDILASIIFFILAIKDITKYYKTKEKANLYWFYFDFAILIILLSVIIFY